MRIAITGGRDHRVTREEVEAARTPAGGWTRAQLEAWGVPWPPPSGWKRRLVEQEAPPESTTKGGRS